MRLIVILLLLLSLSGCYTTINQFNEVDTHESLAVYGNVDNFLKYHFTPEAYEAIKDIPLVTTSSSNGGALAAGTNFWSSVASFFMGCGIDRKVIVLDVMLGFNTAQNTLIHEYIHHLHDMTLDGDGEWIDEEEFRHAYAACARNTRYAGIVRMVEVNSDNFWTNNFGINDIAEHIAYTGAHCATHSCPSELLRVYRKILSQP